MYNKRAANSIENCFIDKTDLMQDLVSMTYSFSARMYGLRKINKKQ